FNRAYVDLILAWGLARLGERTACQELTTQARSALGAGDAAHEFLAAAYEFRARQALEGQPHAGPLAPNLRARLAELAERERTDASFREAQFVFKIERLRQASRILEPEERIRAFEEGHLDRSTALREIADRTELSERLTQSLAVPRDQLARALAVALDLA